MFFFTIIFLFLRPVPLASQCLALVDILQLSLSLILLQQNLRIFSSFVQNFTAFPLLNWTAAARKGGVRGGERREEGGSEEAMKEGVVRKTREKEGVEGGRRREERGQGGMCCGQVSRGGN